MARNHYDFTNQRAIVIGAQGIGRAFDRLVAGSAKVAIWDMDASLAESVASEYPKDRLFRFKSMLLILTYNTHDSTKDKLGGAEVLVNSAELLEILRLLKNTIWVYEKTRYQFDRNFLCV